VAILRHRTGRLLQRMINVIGDADVLTEELLAHAVVQAGALVRQCGGGEIVKKEIRRKIENGGGFEDYGVTSGGKFARVDGRDGFFAGAGASFCGSKARTSES